jgi:nicotinamidase-related amidase
LVVVDVQNDFISGSLSISNCPAKQNGEEVRSKVIQPACCTLLLSLNDFLCEKGSNVRRLMTFIYLKVVEPINRLLDSVEFDCVYYTLDWHPENHISFVENVANRKLHSTSSVSSYRLEEGDLLPDYERCPMICFR